MSYKELVEKTRKRLIQFAKLTYAEHRQYDGYFDNWVVAKATSSYRYKGGTVVAPDRWLLASPDLATFFDPDTGHCCSMLSSPLKLVK